MRKLNLIEIWGNSYMASGAHAVGVYLDRLKGLAVLIDSGAHAEAAERIDRKIIEYGCRITAIIHTHGHADHFGGTSYLKGKYPDLRIFAAYAAAPFIENPYLEAFCYGCGVLPNDEWTGIEITEPLQVTDKLQGREQTLRIHGMEFQIIPLPGHFPGMIGVRTRDQVLYCGDALFGEKTLRKQELLFYTDISAARATLEQLQKLQDKSKSYVLYHGGAYEDMDRLVEKHLHIMDETCGFILNLLRERPLTVEELTQRAMEKFKLEDNLKQYGLTYTVVRAYITELEQQQQITTNVEKGRLIFRGRP
ncbi:MBL fold metallo-hydrolase [Paenibacillus eucommiae]|uniref:Glyoxylase-like metal-dependent hydrolase (Beta-lactamase superfamily II) n=1 Tax=Paenibacillus eucommiae TaxID=1355755 RepID=A0ABS4IT99_9BACL|nr:MBL fold metallo-hydrolase [Paenibacillus eucommiae]MBP1990795.1 glyoxylase-like metal-dependent hydrolase (beta-lactamase superfamily II) [Paenibacillus eucommiae]